MEHGDEPSFRSSGGARAGAPDVRLSLRWTRNTATVLILQGFWTPTRNTIRHSCRNGSGGATAHSERKSSAGEEEDNPTPPFIRGLVYHNPPRPIVYSRRVNTMSLARMSALALPPAYPFLNAFLPHFAAISDGFRATP